MKVVESIKSILGDNTSMSNKDKFEEEFGPPDSDSEEESEDDRDSETAAGKSKRKSKKRKVGTDRPEDWKALFEGDAALTTSPPLHSFLMIAQLHRIFISEYCEYNQLNQLNCLNYITAIYRQQYG